MISFGVLQTRYLPQGDPDLSYNRLTVSHSDRGCPLTLCMRYAQTMYGNVRTHNSRISVVVLIVLENTGPDHCLFTKTWLQEDLTLSASFVA